MTHALTIWQPWASLIMTGAKPFEFRRWAAPKRFHHQRIVIHAGARLVELDEILELIVDLRAGKPAGALIAKPALELLDGLRLQLGYKWRQNRKSATVYSAGLGTAVLGKPIRCVEFPQLFGEGDSSRIDEHIWAWPLSDVRPFPAPIPARGAQGFWPWMPDIAEAANAL
jgi:hypothetical protein